MASSAGKFHSEKRNALITFTQFRAYSHLETWKSDLLATEQLPCSSWGLSALLKGTPVVVMKDEQVLLFTFPALIYPASLGN